MSKKVIDPKYLPLRPIGVFHWLVAVIALEYFGAVGWVWGLACGVLGILTICTWWAKVDEEYVKPSELEPSQPAYNGRARV